MLYPIVWIYLKDPIHTYYALEQIKVQIYKKQAIKDFIDLQKQETEEIENHESP